MKKIIIGILIIAAALVAGYYAFSGAPSPVPDASETAKAVVVGFGGRLQMVPLTASAEIASQAIEENYAPYVTKDLLARWAADPSSAPGRLTSSPWPDRIEVSTVSRTPGDTYVVSGDIIEVTSVELANGGVAARDPFTATVSEEDGSWRISAFQTQ